MNLPRFPSFSLRNLWLNQTQERRNIREKTVEQYEQENINHKLSLKKQEKLTKATSERGNKNYKMN